MAGLDKLLYNLARRWSVPRLTIADLAGAGDVFADSTGRLGALQCGKTYFVAGNHGLDTNDGSSWDKAFKTLAVALAASHANIALNSHGWAARNRIFISGDSFEEDLTKGAQKTDIIGVGSCDHHPMARIIGNHVFDSTKYMGMRFINVAFKSPADGGVIMTVPTEQSGIAFLGCYFDARSTTAATTGILVTASELFTVSGCRFVGPFSTAAISVGAGSSNGLRIWDNDIESGAIGILVNSSATCANQQGVIGYNRLLCQTLIIDENSDKFAVIGNRGYTAANAGATTYDLNVRFASDNQFSSGNVDYAEAVPVIRWGAQS